LAAITTLLKTVMQAITRILKTSSYLRVRGVSIPQPSF
jgi:hypothetical protein